MSTPIRVPRWRRTPSRTAIAYLAVFMVAAAARSAMTFRHGSWKVDTGYDASVYFAGTDAFVHGRLPYADFIMLHPPAALLLLSPFGALTYVVSDSTAYGIALVAFAVLGGVNAVLVMRVAQRFGLSLPAALAGGGFYALWFGAVIADHVTKLEPIGNLLLLVALLSAGEAQRRPELRRPPLLAGAALGLAISVKIWWVVPLVLIGAWLGATTPLPETRRWFFGGAAITAFVVNLPFFVADPGAMWRSVIVDQVGRRATDAEVMHRLSQLTMVQQLEPKANSATVVVFSLVVGVVFVVAAARAASQAVGRGALVMLGAQLFVLLAAPAWSAYYADYVGVQLALVVAAAVRVAPRPAVVAVGWLPVLAAAVVTGLVIGLATTVSVPFGGTDKLSRSAAQVRCVMSDSPMALIELDVLSTGLSNGCPNWIDPSGQAYDRRLSGPRRRNRLWQHDVRDYLRCGDAAIMLRPQASGLSARTRRVVRHGGLLAEGGGHRVYRVTDPVRSSVCQ